ncbi:MAG: FHA domain-containing protein [Myxococcales bacterium]|nr:FHA domain-containing protein [Myxococcales bacterium]
MGSPAPELSTQEIGICCGRCETYSRVGTLVCEECGNDLAIEAARPSSLTANAGTSGNHAAKIEEAQRRMTQPARSIHDEPTSPYITALDDDETTMVEAPPSELLRETENLSKEPAVERGSERNVQLARPPNPLAGLSEEELMDQAKHFVCTSCMTPVPTGHKFCGRCGAEVPPEIRKLQVHFFSEMQDPEKARLILIRGEGMDALSYHLKLDQHIVGRSGQLEFPDDPFISPKHANFFYRDTRLVVRDECSLNGVYLRIRGSVELSAGDTFLAGEQVFRLDPTPKASDAADGDGTFFYSSPKHPTAFRLVQMLEGGSTGMTVCARGTSLQIGRENGDLNFPGDVYMSAQHCTVADEGGKFTLTDHDSRNGTYVRIKTEATLGHGDYVFIGRKLLRVELNVN